MARSRNIKPSIMDNESLAALPALTRLLFIYMWMLADKEGRLEDRPSRIKKQAIGYDDCDADAMLSELAKAGFIDRYEVDGRKLIQITKFAKHQTPHVREAASELPEKAQSTTKAVPSTGQGESKASPRSSDSGFLIPDSLIPDSGLLIPDSKNKEPRGSLLPASRKSKLPNGFYPNENGIQKAEGLGVNVEIELVKFTDYHRAKGSTMADWQAAWRTWVGNAATFSRAGPVNRQASIEARNKAVGEEWLRQEGSI